MHAPKWKLFSVLWAVTVALWVLPYVIDRFGSLDLKNAFTGYPWNFSPMYAVALFGGAFLRNRTVAVALPVVAYAGVNLAIWALSGKLSYAAHPVVWICYALYALIPAFGFGLETQEAPLRSALGRSFAAAVMFFALSNLAVFAFEPIYAKTLAGLGDCFYQALPFFPATLGSTVLFTGALFSPVGLKLATQPAVKA
ncbi:MAG TPA: DUF6580 family putative transport protein [Caulifigura sp.]|nr:DUF6580 family putative transport protein [Caulifigura sp.]